MYVILGSMVLVLAVIVWSERRNKLRKAAVQNFAGDSVKIIEVSNEIMDKAFNRSAGRYCEYCGVHGSHHTDRHNDYATFAINKQNNGGMIDISSIIKIK